ncbi:MULTISPECIES: right-handed parallel beta-helix repeat-containing protein [Cyanophyceae]|uniref:beta strand repeat-containing protein n=1 Tax=Cyanophyceae TaxID=3028117 RepID=UPI0016891C72|nr:MULTISPECIES: right-handed parallel beta-helix repeat-containing protein [Cyanophyceae]MBD1917874.1 right-handed parallel beta-helix repeat-containing protein [Phormidium sp. FACHB-77]MBD2029714.1 right-handed parallel beta-helix repeat-containing protein [Phormidium sp. FACHB-322]MBD2052531.1 right-handed parallel beta-helix repeat-containing protein [Leptolyngbya sp. FACHB-60]
MACLIAGPAWAEPGALPAEVLEVQPWGGINFETVGGSQDFGSLEGFLPLWQVPGQQIWFLQGRARLDTAGFLGSNLMLGYRTLGGNRTSLTGGYVGIDTQAYGGGTFYQTGAGLEHINNGWELRGNVYWPLGDRSTATTLLSTAFFEGNQLLLPTTRQVAMAGGDMSVGGAIATLGSLGSLNAYGGLYYYSPPDQPGFFGGRAWLAASPLEGLNLRLGLQYDDYFGANVLLQTGFSWGGSGPRSAATGLALGQPIQRTMGITLGAEAQVQAAIDPDTNQAYRFYHVQPGSTAAGDGTAAAPYGAIDPALSVASSGDRVYVQPGSLASGFTIPSGVQVLSTGPLQPLRTQVGTLALPGSGSGLLPHVPGTVTMGHDSLLSGFAVAPEAGQDGIQAFGVRSVTILGNQVLSTRNGILLNDVSGNLIVRRNQIQDASENGILLNLSGQTVNTADLSNNDIHRATGNGLLVRAADASQINSLQLNQNRIGSAGENGLMVMAETNSRLGTVAIAETQIAAAGENGVLVLAGAGGQIDNLTLSQLDLGTTGTNGLLLLAEDGTIAAATVADVSLGQSQGNGVLVLADNGSHLGPVNLTQLQMATTAENGVALLAFGGSRVGPFTLSQSDLGQVGSNGVLVLADTSSALADTTLDTVAIQSAGANGLLVLGQNSSTLATVTVNDLTVGRADANGLVLIADSGSQIAAATLSAPQVASAGENGVLVLANNGGQIATVTLDGGDIQQAGQSGVLALAMNGSQIQHLAVTNTEIGSEGAAAIANNGILILTAQGSRIEAATLDGNRLTGVGATGIQLLALDQSQLGTARISGNQLQSIGGDGIFVMSEGQSQISQTTIAGNQLQAIDQVGMQVLALNQGQIAATQISDNTLDTIGADGMVAFAESGGQLATVTADSNRVSQVARNGLSLFATNGGTIDQAALVNNQTQTVGNNGIFAFADGTGRFSTLSVVGNQIQGSGNHALELGNESAQPLCAQITNNQSTATTNLDANLFVGAGSTLQVVDLTQLNQLNNGTFTQINSAGAIAGSQGKPPCP